MFHQVEHNIHAKGHVLWLMADCGSKSKSIRHNLHNHPTQHIQIGVLSSIQSQHQLSSHTCIIHYETTNEAPRSVYVMCQLQIIYQDILLGANSNTGSHNVYAIARKNRSYSNYKELIILAYFYISLNLLKNNEEDVLC